MTTTLHVVGEFVKEMIDALWNRRERLGAQAFIAGFRQDVRASFDGGIDPTTGQPWPPRKKAYPHPPLVKTGAMKAVALATADAAKPSGWGVTITLPGPGYAFIHVRGAPEHPRRNFWGVSPATQAAAARQCKEEVVKLATGG